MEGIASTGLVSSAACRTYETVPPSTLMQIHQTVEEPNSLGRSDIQTCDVRILIPRQSLRTVGGETIGACSPASK